ncbi:MAG: alpha/beta hydrolase family protein [Bacteroidota bacterium]
MRKLNRKHSRRSFLKRNAMLNAGLLLGTGTTHAAITRSPRKDRIEKAKVYAVPSHFQDVEDMPADLFGDLGLIRKGTPEMTIGGGATSIEPITSVDEWDVKANALRTIFKMALGTPPSDIDCDLSVRVENEFDREDIIERRVSYKVGPNERIAAIMLIPKGISSPRPALLTIHPTTEKGKEQTVGRGETVDGKLTDKAYNRAYGMHLAKRGYVTFSPDIISAGERMFPGKRAFDNQPFIKANPHWSGVGKDLWDLQRAIDVMQTFSEINPSRIGSIGHSQGAYLTCQLRAIDERVKVGVSNCGIWPSRIAKNPFNRARTDWWTGWPLLRPFFYAGKPAPIDDHEIIALSAPRPFLDITALNDSGYNKEEEPFTRAAWENLRINVKKIYALHGAEDKFNTVFHLDGHDFPEKQRDQAYTFIEQHL